MVQYHYSTIIRLLLSTNAVFGSSRLCYLKVKLKLQLSTNAVFIHADPSATPQLLLPTESEERIAVGGDYNEWLNITSVVIQGEEDPDSKIFMCEVCTNQSAPLKQCYTSNFTLRVIGAPPVISNPPNSSKIN